MKYLGFFFGQVEAKIYFCEPDGACYMQGVLFKLPIIQKPGEEKENVVKLHYKCIKPTDD